MVSETIDPQPNAVVQMFQQLCHTRVNHRVVLIVVVLLLLVPLGGLAAEKKQAPPSTPVHTAPVREALVSQQVSIIGTTEAFRKSTVAAEVSGRVETLYVRKVISLKKELLWSASAARTPRCG